MTKPPPRSSRQSANSCGHETRRAAASVLPPSWPTIASNYSVDRAPVLERTVGENDHGDGFAGFAIFLNHTQSSTLAITRLPIGENDLTRLGRGLPMAALAVVGAYGVVFHTKIARSSRRTCNFMIPKGECAPAVFSIPIARSIFCWLALAYLG